jgi:hypothetical protein
MERDYQILAADRVARTYRYLALAGDCGKFKIRSRIAYLQSHR